MTGLARRVAVLVTASVLSTVSVLAGASTATAAGDVGAVPVRQIGGPGHAALYGWGMGTALDGSIYVADYWNYRIQHFATDGSLLGTIVPPVWDGATKHQPPYGIAVDPVNGDLYFGDVDDNATVDKYSADGDFLLSFGGKGESQDGKFLYPSYVAVTSDRNVYVVDSRDHDVEVFDPQGNRLFGWGGQGSAPGQFDNPRGVDVDAQDNLYIADNRNNRVQVFDKHGTFLRQFGGAGNACPAADGLFCPGDNLRGLAVDAQHGWVYVVDAVGGYINKFDLQGRFLLRWGGLGHDQGTFADGGRDVTVDGAGNVWVGDMGNFRVQKFSPNGVPLAIVPDPPQPPAAGGLNQPVGVAVDSQGNVFVADTMDQRVNKYDANGDPVTSWGERGSSEYGLNYPRGIATDPRNDDVVLCDSDNGAVKKYDNDGAFKWSKAQGLKCYSVDVGPDGRIYLANFGDYSVQVLDENGERLYSIGSAGSANGQFWYPRGVALDADGSVWVTDSTKGNVQHFDNAGNYLGKFGSRGTDPQQFDQPADIEVDGTYVYVSDEDASVVKVFNKDGTFVTNLGGLGSAIGQLKNPYGMDLLPGGRLFVVDRSQERVQQWQLTFAGGGSGADVSAPDSYVESPSGNQSMSVQGFEISGTAVDDRAVATVKVAIRNRATGEWWRGAGWGPFLWLNVPLDQPGQASTSWSYHWRPPAAGDYAVQVRSEDAVGNVDPQSPFVLFSVYDGAPDAVAPETTVAVPSVNQLLPNAPATLAGGATDNSAVSAVRVSVQNRQTGAWWQPDGSWGGAFAAVDAPLTQPGGPSTAWSLNWVPPGPGDYGMQAAALDRAGNVDASVPYVPFTVYDGVADTHAPETSVSSPTVGQYVPTQPVTIAGTATDGQSVASVAVAVQDRVSKKWWQLGGGWADGFQSFSASLAAPGAAATAWSWSWVPPGPGSYAVWAKSKDIAGNTDPTQSFVDFTVYPGSLDTVAPDATLLLPLAGSALPSTAVTVSGVATDDRAITRVDVAVRNRSTNQWWQPQGGWGTDYAAAATTLTAPGSTSTQWTWSWTPPGAGDYAFQVQARDLANQADPTPASVSFSTYPTTPDTVKPETSVTAPVGGSQVPLGTLTLAGKATDNYAVTGAQVALKNVANGLWWTGSAWGAFKWLDATVPLPSTNATWSYAWTPPAAGQYAMQSRAKDAAGNLDAKPTFTQFTVYSGVPDTIAPTGTITTPTVNQQVPKSVPFTIRGSANDNAGVAKVQVAIKNGATGQWWTGTTWGAFTWLNATPTSPGATATAWSFTWTPPAAGSFGVQLNVKDAAGLANTPKPFVNFRAV